MILEWLIRGWDAGIGYLYEYLLYCRLGRGIKTARRVTNLSIPSPNSSATTANSPSMLFLAFNTPYCSVATLHTFKSISRVSLSVESSLNVKSISWNTIGAKDMQIGTYDCSGAGQEGAALR